MHHLRRLTLIATLVIFSAACTWGPNSGDKFEYPLAVGHQWEYDRTFSTLSYNSDSLAWVTDYAISSTIVVTIESMTTLSDTIPVYVLEEILTESEYRVFESTSYYNNLADGLYFYAYRNGGWASPKALPKEKYILGGREFGSIGEITDFIVNSIPEQLVVNQSVIIESPPLQSIRSPLRIGAQWVYRTAGNPWRYEKRVVSEETIEVPAGKFRCYKIQWLIDVSDKGEWDESIQFYDFVSTIGLVKRSVRFVDMVRRNEQADSLGLFDGLDESVLTATNVQ